MRTFFLTLAFAALVSAGCRTHMHAGGGQGFDAGASIGRESSYPPVVVDLPPRPMPPR